MSSLSTDSNPAESNTTVDDSQSIKRGMASSSDPVKICAAPGVWSTTTTKEKAGEKPFA
jgi:hypothetical protein